jgi:hypothetical protein
MQSFRFPWKRFEAWFRAEIFGALENIRNYLWKSIKTFTGQTQKGARYLSIWILGQLFETQKVNDLSREESKCRFLEKSTSVSEDVKLTGW